MKTLSGLNDPVLSLGGEPLVEGERVVTVGFLIANVLARGSCDEPVRAMDVALKIYNADGSVDLEDADFATVNQTVREDRFMTNIAKAAVLRVLAG